MKIRQLGPRYLVAIAALLPLMACGGGGSGSGGTPTPTNSAPTFSAASQSVDFAENGTGVVFTASASDPEGQAVSYSLSGTDAARFTINASGAISFVDAPNFDMPQDSDRNNSYEFSVTASDGRASSSLAATVRVTNDKEGVSLSLLSHFDDPGIVVSRVNQASTLLVVKQDGTLIRLDPATGGQTVFGNAFNPGETGQVVAASQDRSWVFIMLQLNGSGTVVRFRHATNPSSSSPTTYLDNGVISTASGAMIWSGGYLYAALGDPDGQLARNPGTGFGKLFRVDFDPYCGASLNTICLGNTMIGEGIHAPVGGFALNGQAVLFDRGTSRQDELVYFNPAARPLDFGWPELEGSIGTVTNPPAAVNGPFLGLERGGAFGQANGIVGGIVYAGGIASLNGKLIFGDISGRIFAAPAGFATDGILHTGFETEDRTEDFRPASGTLGEIRQVIASDSGQIFVINATGDVFVAAGS